MAGASEAGPIRSTRGGMHAVGTRRSCRGIVAGALLAAGASVLVAACSTVPHPPTYTGAELQTMCESRGGWWRGSLIPGYCEYQAAHLNESP
jgi:hypothetical protein